jgi:HPt (histidine-containing phosphotransfer) domain-containing protein
MTVEPVIDAAALDQMLEDTGGEAEFVIEIIDDYLENACALLADIGAAVSAGDAAAGRAAAHTLKSTSASVGAVGYAAIAKEAEEALGTGDVARARDILPRLETGFPLVEAALAREKTRLEAAA